MIARYFCNKCGHHGTSGPEHFRPLTEDRCHYHAAKMPDAPETLPDCRTCYYIRGTIGEEWCSLLREDCRNGSNYVARWGIDPVRLYQPRTP